MHGASEATRLAYHNILAYFSQPDAVLAKGFEGEDGSDGSEVCSYRNVEGNKCAVGCRIPDELYNVKFERRTVDGLLAFPELRSIIGHPEGDESEKKLFSFLSEVQFMHDCQARDAAEFVNMLVAYAKGLGIER